MVNGVQLKNAKKKNCKTTNKHHLTVEPKQHRRRQKVHHSDSKALSVFEQENTCPSSKLQKRHNNNVFAPTHSFTYNLHKIGRPRELLKRDISWKVFIS